MQKKFAKSGSVADRHVSYRGVGRLRVCGVFRLRAQSEYTTACCGILLVCNTRAVNLTLLVSPAAQPEADGSWKMTDGGRRVFDGG